MATETNPHGICTWRPASECEDCQLGEHLKCRFDHTDLLHFLGMFVAFALPAVIGVIRGGYGWYLLGWAGFALIFFELWEIRILCSHCPYYAEESLILHCLANYGSLKVWKYHPEPMSRWEKIQLFVGFAILGGYPFPFLILGRQFVLAAIALLNLGMFLWTLRRYTCSQCVNFSCPLNRVPKEIVDAYLRRNPAMRKAWKESGYRIGD